LDPASGKAKAALEVRQQRVELVHVGRRLHLRQRDAGELGTHHAFEVVQREPGGEGVEADRARLSLRRQRFHPRLHERTGAALLPVGNGILEVEDEGVGAVAGRLFDPLRAMAGNEQRGA
jgi:hypothetical protein